jgi:hypothetical protein
LASDANESRRGFLLNHLITDELPSAGERISNSDPVTGQAGWYDVRVRIYPAESQADTTLPQFAAMSRVPGMAEVAKQEFQAYFAGRGQLLTRLTRKKAP